MGNLGNEPEIRSTQDGREIANLSIATSDTWRDKSTGERREKTEWHRVVVFNEGLVNVIKNYLRKGSKVYLEGALQTRKWQDANGQDRYTTEVVLQGFGSNLTMLDGRNSQEGGSYNQGSGQQNYSQPAQASAQAPAMADASEFVDESLDDDIPF